MDGMNAPKHAVRTWRGTALAVLIGAVAVGLAAYAAAASYDTVSTQAAAHGVALPRLNPIGIDGGLFAIIVFDIALTWCGCPIWWLRLAARAFALGTIAANASAGWPSPVGIGLRIAAPALFVLIAEGARTVLLRERHAAERKRQEAAAARRREDRIPLMRWLLDFRGTLAIWKRMQLWREPSYAKAVSMELDRLAAIEKLAMRYGSEWPGKAPADLAWMLSAGVRMPEALARVAELCAAPAPETLAAPAAPAAGGPQKPAGPVRRSGTGTARRGTAVRTGTGTGLADAPDDDLELEARALKLLATNLNMTGAELGRKLGVTEGYGRKLRRRLTGDRPSEAEPDRAGDRAGTATGDRSEDRA